MKKITYEDRLQIQKMVKSYTIVSKIAETIGISLSALYVELRRGVGPDHIPKSYYDDYSADLAQSCIENKPTGKLELSNIKVIDKLLQTEEVSEICKLYKMSRERFIAEYKSLGGSFDFSKTRSSYKLNYNDRVKIEKGLKNKLSVQQIAAEIGCHRGTIYRELKKNGCQPPYTSYNAESAQKRI